MGTGRPEQAKSSSTVASTPHDRQLRPPVKLLGARTAPRLADTAPITFGMVLPPPARPFPTLVRTDSCAIPNRHCEFPPIPGRRPGTVGRRAIAPPGGTHGP